MFMLLLRLGGFALGTLFCEFGTLDGPIPKTPTRRVRRNENAHQEEQSQRHLQVD